MSTAVVPIKYKINRQNKEDCCCYGQISINELNKIDIRTYDNIKIINSNYFNFAEKRGLFWKREEVPPIRNGHNEHDSSWN